MNILNVARSVLAPAIVVIVMEAGLASPLYAQTKTKQKLIESYLIAPINSDRSVLESILDKRVSSGSNVIASFGLDQPQADELLAKYKSDLSESLSPLLKNLDQNLKDTRGDHIKELDQQFTKKELQAVIDFFNSELGQRYSKASLKQANEKNQIAQSFQKEMGQAMAIETDRLIQAAKAMTETVMADSGD